MVTGTVKRSFGVGAIGLSVTVVRVCSTFLNIDTIYSITRITIDTGAVEGALCVGAVGISMAVMSEMAIFLRYFIRKAFIDILACDSIPGISMMTSAIERTFSVGTISISMAVVGILLHVLLIQTIHVTFIDIFTQYSISRVSL